MSVASLNDQEIRPPRWLASVRTAAWAGGGLACVTAGLWLVTAATVGTAPPSPPSNPFGLPVRDVGPQSLGAVSAVILALQAQFYAALTAAVQALKTSPAAFGSLITVGFLYGVFHAAGPGHGKGVIGAYMAARGATIPLAIGLSTAAALLQAFVAIAIVGTLAVILNQSAVSIDGTARMIETMSFLAIVLVGSILLWAKARQCEDLFGGSELEDPAEEMQEHAAWPSMVGVVVAAGSRPCTGAILLLVVSQANGLLFAGILGALAMGLGTALTTSSLAIMVVLGRRSLTGLVQPGRTRRWIEAGFELLAASFIVILGAIFLTGLMKGLPSLLD